MDGHAKICAELFYELAKKSTQQQKKVTTPCVDDHQVKEEKELKLVGWLSNVCFQIVLKYP